MWPFTTAEKKYDTENEIPDLSGKVILVTGGNDGIGKGICLAMVKHNPGHIYIGARDASKAEAAIKELNELAPTTPVSFVKMDLASFESVRSASKEILASAQRLDYLFLNAGVMALDPGLSKDGYEVQFGINHVGHALLTKLLLPTLLKTAKEPGSDVRIIITTSGGYFLAPNGGIVFKELKTTQANIGPMNRYGQTKLANILYAEALAKRYPNIISASIAPGVTESGMAGKAKYSNFIESFLYSTLIWLMNRPTEFGAGTLLWAAFAPRDKVENGQYYDIPYGTVGKRNAYAKNMELADELWAWTEKELEGQAL